MKVDFLLIEKIYHRFVIADDFDHIDVPADMLSFYELDYFDELHDFVTCSIPEDINF